MAPVLDLTADEVLTTTRSVRKRLDLTRPVEREVIEECLEIAVQAPSASHRQNWHFVFVTEPDKRARLAEIYERGAQVTYAARGPEYLTGDPVRQRVRSSSVYLREHMKDVPVLFVPCIEGRTDDVPVVRQAAQWGTIVPAVWSFMLAARSRGLGTCLTTMHLHYERDAAEVLGIPYDEVMQTGLIPVAYTVGTDFKRASRQPMEKVLHWDGW
jgi:nitroreductase